MLLRLEDAAVGRYGSKEPCVCECFLACPLTGESIFVLIVNGDTSLSVEELSSARTGVAVGREKFWRLEELLFAFAFAKTVRRVEAAAHSGPRGYVAWGRLKGGLLRRRRIRLVAVRVAATWCSAGRRARSFLGLCWLSASRSCATWLRVRCEMHKRELRFHITCIDRRLTGGSDKTPGRWGWVVDVDYLAAGGREDARAGNRACIGG